MKQTDLKTFGVQIKKYLDDLGMSQSRLARLLEVSDNTVSTWLNEKTQPHWLRPLYLLIELLAQKIEDFNPMLLFYPDWKDNEIERLGNDYRVKLQDIESKYGNKLKEIKEEFQNKITKIEKFYPQSLNEELLKNRVMQSELDKLKAENAAFNFKLGI